MMKFFGTMALVASSLMYGQNTTVTDTVDKTDGGVKVYETNVNTFSNVFPFAYSVTTNLLPPGVTVSPAYDVSITNTIPKVSKVTFNYANLAEGFYIFAVPYVISSTNTTFFTTYQITVKDTRISLGRSVQVIPHIALGSGWEMNVSILNKTDLQDQYRLTFFDSAGSPVNVSVLGQTLSVFDVVLNPRENRRITLRNVSNFIPSGYILVTSMSNLDVSNVSTEYVFEGRNSVVVRNTNESSRVLLMPFSGVDRFHGFAFTSVLNSSTSQNIVVQFYNSTGGLVQVRNYIVSGGSSKVFNSFDFPSNLTDGYVKITAEKSSVYGLSLTFNKTGEIQNNPIF